MEEGDGLTEQAGSPAAAELLCEEAGYRRPHLDDVLRVDGTVAFIGLNEVVHLDTAVAQRGDQVVGLGLDDTDIVGALDHQQRRADLLSLDTLGESGVA